VTGSRGLISISEATMAAVRYIQPTRFTGQIVQASHVTFRPLWTAQTVAHTTPIPQQFSKRSYATQLQSSFPSRISSHSYRTERWRTQSSLGQKFSGRLAHEQIQRRLFSRSIAKGRDHHFDTLKFVQRLKDEGFTEEQSVAVMKVLSDVIEER
jgi:hypothetical protein